MKKQSIYPALQITDACNKQCAPCLRYANTKSYKLRYDQFLAYLGDLETLSQTYAIGYQFVTGGEPTIWRDDGKDIVDVVKAVDDLECVRAVVLPTNGKVFEDAERARELLSRLSGATLRKTIISISIADYQNNFDEHGCKAFDNFVSISKEVGLNAMPILLVTLSVKDDMGERVSAKYPKVGQRVSALAPLGGATSMKEKCPSLVLSGKDKSTLGSFLPYFKRDVVAKLGVSEKDFYTMPNAEVMDRLSLFNNCGRSPIIGERWHYCVPFIDNPHFDLCEIGEARKDTLANFLGQNPLVRSFREKGILTTVHQYRGRLSRESTERLDEMLNSPQGVSVAYRGCMICKELHDNGVAEELRESL